MFLVAEDGSYSPSGRSTLSLNTTYFIQAKESVMQSPKGGVLVVVVS